MMRRIITTTSTTAILAMLLLFTIGCATGEKSRDTDAAEAGYPRPLTITMHVESEDRRYVYYEVDRQGYLHYAGGRDANLRQATKLGKLSDEQLRYLWQIIDRYGLLEGDGELFAKGAKVYEVELKAGRETAQYETSKNKLAGLDHLDKALFKMQGEIRYGEVTGAIDERIDRAGGAVKKK